MIRFIELFAGIGGFRNGLERVDNVERIKTAQQIDLTQKRIPNNTPVPIQERGQSAFTCVYANEWGVEEQKREWLKDHDPEIETFSPSYAHRIYRRQYGEIDTRDIRDVSEFPDFDLLTAGFPCQAFSIAGKQGGFDDTRGTLFFEIARILQSKRPGHILLENVKNLIGHDDSKTFHRIFGVLSDLGYRVEWMVLNSKHFGVPQNRERVFIIGHLRGECTGEVFPIRQSTSTFIQDSKNEEGQEVAWAVRERDYKDGTNFWGGGNRIRRLTPVECELLQGFFPSFTEFGMLEDGTIVAISDTQRYKCLGNAVTTTVITAIGTGLLQHIEDQGGI